MRLQLAGLLDRAEQLYCSILLVDQRDAMANHCYGMLQVQRRRPTTALPYLLNALTEHPENPNYWLGYLEALLQSGRTDDARASLELARQSGLSGAAVEDFAQRLATLGPAPASPSPSPPPSLDAPVSRMPQSRGKEFRRADGALQRLIGQKRAPEALELARDITRRFPERGVGWKKLGALLCWGGQFGEALVPLANSVRLLPADAEAHSNLGVALLHEARLAEAIANFNKAIDIDPRWAAAHYYLGMACLQEQRFADGQASLCTAVALRPDYLTDETHPVLSELLYLYSHDPARDAKSLFAEHGTFSTHFETPVRNSWPRHANVRDPDRQIRVGFVSGDLLDHSIATFLEPVVSLLAQSRALELHAYHNCDREDEVTRRLRRHFHAWRPVSALGDAELATQIATDGIDVLIDLSGHTALNRLRTFARKPAPLQISWLGYPGTTGLQAMDYYLADERWLPADRFAGFFTEKLVYLPDRWAFVPHPDAPDTSKLPALVNGHLTFGSFLQFGKINAFTVDLWARVLCALPTSRLLMAGLTTAQQTTLEGRFADRGVAPERVIFHPRYKMGKYLELHNQVDIALDSQPYSAATTTMHALSMGVPTLTVHGGTSWGAACAGILRHVALDEFIAANPDDFVALACRWSLHLENLALLRAGLRARLLESPACQRQMIAAHFEGALRHAWRRWCAGLPPASFHARPVTGGD